MRNPDEKVNTEAFRDIYVNGQGTADCRLRTVDCGLGIKHELGIKCGLRTSDKNCANLF